jgi:hypothetical protein
MTIEFDLIDPTDQRFPKKWCALQGSNLRKETAPSEYAENPIFKGFRNSKNLQE